jgi:hypothetical protein
MSKIYNDQQLYTIYEEELNDLTYIPTGFFDKFIHRISRRFAPSIDLKYTITVPVSDFLRGELFCEDVSEVIEKPFTQTNLISILLDDFLVQAKHRKNLYDLYRELHSSIQHPIEIFHYRGDHETIPISKETQRNKEMICTITRKKALRLEIILSDLANVEPEITFTVNDVIQYLYCHFIENYKNGTLTNELKNIVNRLT